VEKQFGVVGRRRPVAQLAVEIRRLHQAVTIFRQQGMGARQVAHGETHRTVAFEQQAGEHGALDEVPEAAAEFPADDDIGLFFRGVWRVHCFGESQKTKRACADTGPAA
jgi:hypothetical protein